MRRCQNLKTEDGEDSHLNDLDDTAEREGKSDQDDEERYEGEEVGTDPGTLLTHRI